MVPLLGARHALPANIPLSQELHRAHRACHVHKTKALKQGVDHQTCASALLDTVYMTVSANHAPQEEQKNF
jgi:hypothetical protein